MPVDEASAQLTLLLAARGPVREATPDRIAALARAVDQGSYAELLRTRGLLPLLGKRLLDHAADAAGAEFRERLRVESRHAAMRAVVLDMVLREAAEALERAGIPVLPLKGTALAARVHGDPALRPAGDVDILVAREQVGSAIEVLSGLGYARPIDAVWVDGLPNLHYSLERDPRLRAAIELHWRVHWSERGFSEELMRTAAPSADGLRQAAGAHDLALLLLFYARDGFHGLRLAADIAAWWDRHGGELKPEAFHDIVRRHPSLRRGLVAALQCAERFVGLPAEPLLRPFAPDRSTRRAVRLADPLAEDGDMAYRTTLMLIDLMLSTGRDKLGFVRRYFVQPADYVRQTYGMTGAHTGVVALRGALYAARRAGTAAPRMIARAARPPRRPALTPD